MQIVKDELLKFFLLMNDVRISRNFIQIANDDLISNNDNFVSFHFEAFSSKSEKWSKASWN